MGYPQGTPVPSVPDLLDGRGNTEAVVVAGLPGLRFSYSGGGYTVLQQLLVDVTGRDFPALASELVLDPAGMRHSTFSQPFPAELTEIAATGHHPGPVPVPGRWHTYPEMAAAGLWSTATDLARFFLAIRASLAGAPGALLPRHIAEQMLVPHASEPHYGLGLQLAAPGEPASIGHGGNDQGYENHAVLYLDTGHGIAMTTNAFYGNALIHSVVVPAVAREYGWPGKPTASTSPAPDGSARYGDFLVERLGNDLVLTFSGQEPLRLCPGNDDRWRSNAINVDVWFDGGTLVVEQDGASIHAERQG